ncbi:hypothetical protein WJX74_005356 [Apatococcus lobatus]|uniref:Protein kinase domain-containing protein n=1 Tax=Apatococcus lobatus TaxID=904363 RepID=A0AAW1SC93_9CHLO
MMLTTQAPPEAGTATVRSVRAIRGASQLLPGMELSYSSSPQGGLAFMQGARQVEMGFSGAACAEYRFAASVAQNHLNFTENGLSGSGMCTARGQSTSQPSASSSAAQSLEVSTHCCHIPPTAGIVHVQTYTVSGGEELRNISQGFTNTTRVKAGLAAYTNITTDATLFLVAGAQLASLLDHASHTFEYLDTCTAGAQSNYTCEISTSSLNATQVYFLLIQNPPDVTASADKLNIINILVSNPLDSHPTVFVPQPTLAPSPQLSGGHRSRDAGAITGAVVGAVVAILALLILHLVLIRRRRQIGKSIKSMQMPASPWAPPRIEGAEAMVWKRWLGCWTPRHRVSSRTHMLSPQYSDSDMTSETLWTSNPISSTTDLPPASQIPQHPQIHGRAAFADMKERLLTGLTQTCQPVNAGFGSSPLPTSAATSTVYRSAYSAQGLKKEVDDSLPPGLRNTWQIALEDLQLDLDQHGNPIKLGSGASGRVYKGNLGGFCPVAVKVVDSQDSRQQKLFVQEVATLRACHSPHIIMFLGANMQEGSTVLVMQYMPNGNLWHAIANDQNREFGWYRSGAKVALDIAAGISYLHSKRIIHLDLKTPNILLDEHNKAYVADIGLGRLLSETAEPVAYAASMFWAAPEQLQRQPCSEASDVFSFGVIMWEIFTGQQPLNRIMRPVRVPEECPQQVADLMQACQQADASKWPTITQVFQKLQNAARLGSDV